LGSVTPEEAGGAGFGLVLLLEPENAMAAIITMEIATIVIAWAFRGKTPVGFPTMFRRSGRGRGSSFSFSGMYFSRTPGSTDCE
jgi:hypothetical protein